MTKYIANAFSLQMIGSFPCVLDVQEVSREEALTVDNVSCVGHADTARVLGVPCNRVSVRLSAGDVLYVAQLQGGRLPEGSTTLPEGFTFKFLRVTIR